MIQINIPMPENCAECPCYGLDEFERNRCNITGHEFPHNIFDGRAEDCPLKEPGTKEDSLSQIKDAHDLLVKSKPQTGYWFISDYEYLNCSCCGNSYYTGCESKSEAQRRLDGGFFFKWCPYCGARMTNKNP